MGNAQQSSSAKGQHDSMDNGECWSAIGRSRSLIGGGRQFHAAAAASITSVASHRDLATLSS